ncbi:SDR family NAD(P)-dependent oxidoreductase [Lentilactobacillus buchneri]|uniref:SDR family NAD(P)-dependent oxidoreductase n=1 Tax=Lentilactobacillus buchneri TaxID=1581 RepID=UPI001290C4A0|nr:glucose 1-dehydrogenase [Lentilactobacillus buchneri]MQN25406.1 glucose 1-dehydrogenase [Lentilactobacillus buchneri]
MAELDGKVAIITGGANGIGLETTKLFLQEGAKVVFTDVNADAGKQVEDELNNQNALFIQQDVGDEAAWEKVVKTTLDQFGTIDILFNNAGIYIIGKIADLTVDTWNKLMRINVLGTFLGLKHVLPVMAENHHGSVINASSIAGIAGSAGHILYGASKGAVRTMTKDAAAEYASKNVRVNSIHPGYIKTGMADYASASLGIPENQLGKIFPLGRLGKRIEVAQTVVFLASDKASFITGVELPIDGGFLAQ